ncbi:MAG: response regulator [Anaerolineae bacterium]|nr:response regulator [Anaerolineae bacterium]
MGEPQRIVVIDDDQDFLEYSRIVLESASFEVLTATDAADGLALIKSASPDLIITDLMMSYTLEGVSITRAIRADPDLQRLPVIVITAIARSIDAELFPDGAQPASDGFLTKPVPPNTLLNAVRACLSSENACRLT